MRRAMQTTINMYKNHPNLKNIKFIVVPIIRELINNFNDISIDFYELQ